MNELLNGLGVRLNEAGGRRVLAMAGAGVAVVALVLIATWGGGPSWVPLVRGLPLEKVSEVSRTLDEAKIEYRLESGGLEVHVPEADLARARVELASQGLTSESGPGFELFDQPAWGMTDFTQRINYRRALEGELERTIREMDGVESARVHLALQQSSVLRRATRPSEASVVVRMRSATRPTAAFVEGVAYLVASSVDELSSEHVTVLDHSGRLMSRSTEGETGLGLSARQLELRGRVESYLEEKAEALLVDVVGASNVRVRVSADLDFDRIDRTTQAVDPDQSLVTREERTELTPGEGEAGGASVAYKTDYAATQTVERFTSGYGDVKRLSVAVLLNDGAPAADGEPPRPLPDAAGLEQLVAAALGLDPGRGDVISVVSVPFDQGQPLPPVEPVPGPGVWEVVDTLQRPVLTVLALIMAFVLGLKAIRSAKPEDRSAAALPPADEGGEEESQGALGGASSPVGVSDGGAALRKQLNAAQAERMQAVTSAVMDRPDLAARVLHAWLKE